MAVTTNSGVAPWNFTLKAGADFNASMTWLDSNGNPMNLTGFSMKLSIKAFPSSPTTLLTITSAASSGSRIVLGGTAGTITLIIAHADTAALPATGLPQPNITPNGVPTYSLGIYDLQYTDASGNVNYLLEGAVSIEPQVTQ